MDSLHNDLQEEFKKYQKGQQEFDKYITTRQKLDGQLTENKMVFSEMEKLAEVDRVYKLVGPVLVKQDVKEAQHTVQKRMDYISGEMKRYDGLIDSLQKKQETSQTKIQGLQQQFQQIQQRVAQAAAGKGQ